MWVGFVVYFCLFGMLLNCCQQPSDCTCTLNPRAAAAPCLPSCCADGTAWGMLLLSSNAMDIVPTEDRLSWRVTGGVLDMFLLAGPTPLAVSGQE